jgi:hypothetical protein
MTTTLVCFLASPAQAGRMQGLALGTVVSHQASLGRQAVVHTVLGFQWVGLEHSPLCAKSDRQSYLLRNAGPLLLQLKSEQAQHFPNNLWQAYQMSTMRGLCHGACFRQVVVSKYLFWLSLRAWLSSPLRLVHSLNLNNLGHSG